MPLRLLKPTEGKELQEQGQESETPHSDTQEAYKNTKVENIFCNSKYVMLIVLCFVPVSLSHLNDASATWDIW